MHIKNRLATVGVWLAILIPFGTTSAMFFTTDSEQTQEQLMQVLDQVKDASKEKSGLSARKFASERVITDSEKKLSAIAKEKRAVRLRLGALTSLLTGVQGSAESLMQEQAQAAVLKRREEQRLQTFLRFAHVRQETAPGARLGSALLRRMFLQSLGDVVDEDLAHSALSKARTQLIELLVQAQESARLSFDRLSLTAGDLAKEVVPLQEKLAMLQSDYLEQLGTVDTATYTAEITEEQLAEAQREEMEVRSQVVKLQMELERIDARIRRKAERDLVDMGLRAPTPGAYIVPRIKGAGTFIWPVKGRLTAGFHEASYLRYFRFPHQGQDIAVPQGSPVYAAATGIVFLARDGGTRGYSYILLGHRGGYATLYGHLSSFSVQTGDYVIQGQVIGYSGGRPGTHGAGPMTTGSHLHFEVIQGGVNIDPVTVLP